MADYKIVIQPERFIMVNKEDKEAELVILEDLLKNLTITKAEIDEWKAEELVKREELYIRRIKETQEILNIING